MRTGKGRGRGGENIGLKKEGEGRWMESKGAVRESKGWREKVESGEREE